MVSEIHIAEGLNWGQRTGQDPNQSYIPLPTAIAKSDFFPPAGVPFSALTDDGFPFIGVMTPPKKKVGKDGYAIESFNNKSELGKYFRRRLGLQSGELVKLEDLDRYGNHYVTFTKIDEDEYYMQFSPSKSKTSENLEGVSNHFFSIRKQYTCVPFRIKNQ
ncbi:MAG: NgoFVII family restriction endonuclease [Kiritimatiellaeota bacterium]|nr:NgoFVII family restriction endonuclease [Kiritimatiellota bacterium]